MVLEGLTYPTSVEFDDRGRMYIAESGYVYGDAFAPTRILTVSPEGEIGIAADQGLIGPITDLLWHEGRLYISHRGRISVLESGGNVRDLVVDLPSLGDHHNNQLTAGPDGKLYFGQGTATNSGVVGVDNFAFGWLPLHPRFHDVPAKNIRLRGHTFLTLNPFLLAGGSDPMLATTGAFAAFGSEVDGQVPGVTKANGTIMRMNADGSGLEVYAWGLRNPFGVQWGRNGKLYASENGFDVRGSRPIANDTDDLYVIRQGAWYGWPDYAAGIPVTDPRFRLEGAPEPEFLTANHPPVERPLLTFAPHSAAAKLAVNRDERFGVRNDLFMALWGHMTPITGYKDSAHQGHQVVRINPQNRQVETFVSNRTHAHGDSSQQQHGAHGEAVSAGLRRPIDVNFSPDGRALYIVDLGVLQVLPTAIPTARPFPGTGVVWRVVPEGEQVNQPPQSLSVKPGGQRR